MLYVLRAMDSCHCCYATMPAPESIDHIDNCSAIQTMTHVNLNRITRNVAAAESTVMVWDAQGPSSAAFCRRPRIMFNVQKGLKDGGCRMKRSALLLQAGQVGWLVTATNTQLPLGISLQCCSLR